MDLTDYMITLEAMSEKKLKEWRDLGRLNRSYTAVGASVRFVGTEAEVSQWMAEPQGKFLYSYDTEAKDLWQWHSTGAGWGWIRKG